MFLSFFLFSFSEELVALTTRFTNELMNQGLTKCILSLVSEINVTREFERLQKERGLGNEKHRKEVKQIFYEHGLGEFGEEYGQHFTHSHVCRFLTSLKNPDKPWQTVCFHGPVNHL